MSKVAFVRVPLTIKPLGFVVSIEATNIKSSGTHGPSMHSGMLHHIVSEITWSILAAPILY